MCNYGQVHTAGVASWELRFDLLEAPHIALVVRDALRLDPTSGRQPPRLSGEIPDLRDRFTVAQRNRLAEAYAPRCHERRLIGTWDARPRGQSRDDLFAYHRDTERRYDKLFGPMAEHADLKRLALDWFAEQREQHEPRHPDSGAERARWEVARDAVELAAAETGVEPGRLRADTWLLMVQGLWWASPRPGQLLYSPSVRADLSLLGGLLQDTFERSLIR